MSEIVASHSYFKTSKVFISIVALFFVSILLLSSILIPIIISFSIYSFLHPFTTWMIRSNISRPLSIITSLLLMVSASVIAVLYALPRLFQQLLQLQQRLPDMLEIIEKYASLASFKITEFSGLTLDLPDIAMKALGQSYVGW